MPSKTRLGIEYCTQCRWMLHAEWVAEELPNPFQTEIAEVALIPSRGNIFEVRANPQMMWSLKGDGRFPDRRSSRSVYATR